MAGARAHSVLQTEPEPPFPPAVAVLGRQENNIGCPAWNEGQATSGRELLPPSGSLWHERIPQAIFWKIDACPSDTLHKRAASAHEAWRGPACPSISPATPKQWPLRSRPVRRTHHSARDRSAPTRDGIRLRHSPAVPSHEASFPPGAHCLQELFPRPARRLSCGCPPACRETRTRKCALSPAGRK